MDPLRRTKAALVAPNKNTSNREASNRLYGEGLLSFSLAC